MIKINGKEFEASRMTILDHLESMGFDPKRVAVEKNGEIVPKATYSKTVPTDGDTIEIVSFVGGG